MRAAAHVVLLALAGLAGCLDERPDPVWMTGNCGAMAAWDQPGLYDAAPDEVEEPAKRRELAPSLPPLLPFEGARPYLLYRVIWGSDVSLFLERSREDGSYIVSAPKGEVGEAPQNGRDQVDAFLENVTRSTSQERAQWTEEMVQSRGHATWWVRIPEAAVELDGLPARLDAMAQREEARTHVLTWSWSVPKREAGMFATFQMELLDPRPTKEYVWTAGDAFLAAVPPLGPVSVRSAAPLPAQERIADAFERMGMLAPSFDGWRPTSPPCIRV